MGAGSGPTWAHWHSEPHIKMIISHHIMRLSCRDCPRPPPKSEAASDIRLAFPAAPGSTSVMTSARLLSLFAFAACTILTLMSTPATAEETGVYRHVVLFKFKDSAPPEQVQAVEAAFKALPSKINTITGFEWGTNVSPEGKDDGFTHCFFVTFKDKAGLEVYLPHPDHKAFGALLRPILDKVLVIDYTAQK
jgi:hypothetical protein